MIPDDAQRLNVLVAFPYFSAKVIAALTPHVEQIRLLVDSGAFTAWKSGKPIEIDDYCKFLETLPIRPWRYFTLDVIGDPEGTQRNYELMLRRGFTPVPIFTRGEDPAHLGKLYETSDVVGIGGLVGTFGNKGFVNGIMRHVAGRRVHLLGFQNAKMIAAHRPYMIDGSTWIGGGMYGLLKVYDGGTRMISLNRQQLGDPKRRARAFERLASMGFDPFELRRDVSWHGGQSLTRRIGAASYIRFSLAAQRALGTLMFMATTDEHQIKQLTTEFDKLQTARLS